MPPTLKFERHFKKLGFEHVAGIDEAGVGALAGPVVAAAIILPKRSRISGLDDSKKLSADKRKILFKILLKKALAIGVGIADSKKIDQINILKASHLAMRLAVEALEVSPDLLLIDGRFTLDLAIPQSALIKGDARCTSIAAASIVAKVVRDRIMEEYDTLYPSYRFAVHKGYGTRLHQKQILRFGPCPIHRQSYNCVASSTEIRKPLDIEQLPLYNFS